MKSFLVVIAVALFLGMASAQAAVIDFNTLGGANQDSFSSFSENGFTVAATSTGWEVGKLYGDPLPAIFCKGCAPGTLDVTGGAFSFSSFDLGESGGLTTVAFDYTVTGLLAGNTVFTQSGTSSASEGFTEVLSSNSSAVLDSLVISVDPSGFNQDANIDNIVLTPFATTVPEPLTFSIFSAGFLGAVVLKRRRAKTKKAFAV
jgi:hypothetical protein